MTIPKDEDKPRDITLLPLIPGDEDTEGAYTEHRNEIGRELLEGPPRPGDLKPGGD